MGTILNIVVIWIPQVYRKENYIKAVSLITNQLNYPCYKRTVSNVNSG